MKIIHLQCEHRYNPLGLDTQCPTFSWKIETNKRNVKQKCIEICVWENKTGIEIWKNLITSENIESFIRYTGTALKPKTKYCWKLKIETFEKENLESEEQWFETGSLGQNWDAEWITNTEIRIAPDVFRKKIICKEKVKSARCYVTAHGVYHVCVNGEKQDTDILAPEFTSYNAFLQYQTYNATEWLHIGENEVELTVADGWYCGYIGMTGEKNQYGNQRALLAQFEVEYDSGEKEIFGTDDSWEVSFGNILFSDLFMGERQDARRNASVKKWKKSLIKDYGYKNLVGQMAQPISVRGIIPVKKVIMTPNEEIVLDFGQVMAGYIRMKVSGHAGDIVTLVHSETVDKNGNFYFNISGEHKDQTDVYILNGEGEEFFQPKFTYHGFRYVKVTGYPGEVKPENFEAVVIGNELEETSEFSCSDANLTKLFVNALWSQRSNMIAIPTDCPQREKAGWTGDIAVFAPTACWNMDMQAFLGRWLKNVAIDQRTDGQIPFLVPYIKSYDLFANMLFGDSSKVASCGWGDAAVLVPWTLYQYYGDEAILKDCYPMMKKWMDYIETQASEGLWTEGFHFGDWMLPSVSTFDPEHPESVFSSAYLTKEWVATCYYAYTTKRMKDICEYIGKKEEAKAYEKKNLKIRNAFAEKYIHEDGTMDAEFQGVYVLALQMQMVPNHLINAMVEHLAEMIKKNDGCLDTGFLSVPFLLDTLYENGKSEIAYQLLFQTKCPSWLYEVRQGATTIWESWNAVLPDGTVTPMSMNHYAYGCVVDFIMRRVVGITLKEPGFKKIHIEPDFTCGLTWVKGSYDSVYGKIGVEWKEEKETTHLKIVLPPNITAEVKFGNLVQVIGSGTYEFNQELSIS